jgi:predicted NAD-dependent protein-ADP-ribosyltransferase YbiA (DUF1768 family)
MVSSKINDLIHYVETKKIDPEDKGYASTVYEMPIHGEMVEFVLGKQKYTYSGKNVLYFPIYLVHNNRTHAQIGVYEIDNSHGINVLDKEKDIDLDKFDEPLMFSFVTEEFIKRMNADVEKHSESKSAEPEDASSEEAEDHDHLHIKTQKSSPSSDESIDLGIDTSLDDNSDVITLEKKTKGHHKNTLFEIDSHHKIAALLKQETEEECEELKTSYKPSTKNNWVENFMQNNNYDIVETESNGDCLFAVIREAFKQNGQITTVAKLRNVLAEEVTDSVFQEHMQLYKGFQTEIDELDKELESMKATNTLYKKRAKKNESKQMRDEIINETQKLKEQYKQKSAEKKQTESLQNEYVGYMKDIKTIEDYREYIKTSRFWADTWAISTLERVLNVKIIIFSEKSYDENSLDSVLNCGEMNADLQEKGAFNPDFYIMTTYSGDHYRLITYKAKRIFKFSEIPYGVKVLIINKCLEKNAGIYWLIQDFRNMKTKLGFNPDSGKPLEEEDDNENDKDLYDKSPKFMFHAKSENTAKPGKGSGESIRQSEMNNYVDLAKNKEWRRKLDDRWSGVVMEIDGRKWASVEHYLQYAKFKKGFPDFASLFSLDSNSELSKDAEIAAHAGSETGKHGKKILRPKHVTPDADYALGRYNEERKLALRAKFTQNEDMKQILLATKRAQLLHFTRREPPKLDTLLMRMRQELYQKMP